MNPGLIPGGQKLSKIQTVFFTAEDPLNNKHRDPNNIDLEAPRLAWYQQKNWKKRQNTVYWVDIKLAQKERIKVLSDAIERHHPSQYTPSLLYPEGYQDGNWSRLGRFRRFP